MEIDISTNIQDEEGLIEFMEKTEEFREEGDELTFRLFYPDDHGRDDLTEKYCSDGRNREELDGFIHFLNSFDETKKGKVEGIMMNAPGDEWWDFREITMFYNLHMEDSINMNTVSSYLSELEREETLVEKGSSGRRNEYRMKR